MKRKRTDGESAKAVRGQGFLLRYKSEPGIVESSVSKSSAYCQYCSSDFSVAHGSKNNQTSHGLWLNTENTPTLLCVFFCFFKVYTLTCI